MSNEADAGVLAEDHVREVSENLTRPRSPECLLCYLNRMVHEFGCDGTLRWSKHWGDLQRPKRFSRKRLERGGGFCDCEVILNVFRNSLDDLDDPTDVNARCRHLSPSPAG